MLVKTRHYKNSGFTLIELLTALAINVVLFAGLIGIFLSNINHYRESINTNRLNQQLQTAMMIMSDDIRRAGYWSNAQNDIGSGVNNNPFMASGVDISVGSGGSCILFAYDMNNNGTLPGISSSIDDERYGFRLSGNTLQTRPPGAAFDCATAASNWEDITNPSVIQVTALNFTLNSSTIATGPGAKTLVQRSVDISLTGRLTSDNTVTKTITKHVRIMNDKFTDE